jgi:hypothetical protein
VLAVGILLISRYFFLRAVQTYEHEYDEKVLELSDYTVLVTGIPESMSPGTAEGAICEYAARQCAALLRSCYDSVKNYCSLSLKYVLGSGYHHALA